MKKILIFTMLLALVLTGCGDTSDSGNGSNAESLQGSGQLGTAESAAGQENAQTEKNSSAENSSMGSGTAEEIPQAEKQIFAMDTYMVLTGYGEKAQEAVDAAAEEIERLDDMLSVGNEDSEIAQINKNGSGKISEDTAIMLEESISLFKSTDGAFDITIYPIMEAWGFTTQNYQVPEKKELEKLLEAVDTSALQYDSESGMLTLSEDQGIDFGAIAKGYASSRVMQIFEEYGLVSGLVSLGGNVQCYSAKTDGSAWRCGIMNPYSEEDGVEPLGVVSVVDKAVITSGGYERYFIDEETGKKYHHIIDPSTGYPAESGLVSVTIVSDNGMLADGLSTSIFIMGLEKAEDYWQEYGDAFDMVLMTEDKEIYITEGLEDSFTAQKEFSVSVIRGK